MTMPSQRTQFAQQGATLIEILITILVVAIGLLGAAGIQLASTRFQQTSILRSEALHQASLIIEKVRANNANLTLINAAAAIAAPETAYIAANDYANAAVLPADPGCGLAGQPACTAAQAAQRDLREWRQSIQQALPGGRGSIFPVVNAALGLTEPNSRRVIVMWREKADLATVNVAGADALENLDPECPAPQVAGIRCLNIWISP